MHLICCVFFRKAMYGLDILAAHIPGKEYRLVDALSQKDFAYFVSQLLATHLCHIPPQVLSSCTGHMTGH